ncbi:MAG: hypothetical protein ACK40G_09175 [Cytophagaceae bacterium]
MKFLKYFFPTAFFIFFNFERSQAQIYNRSNILLETSYGGPNLTSGVIKGIYKASKEFGNDNPVRVKSFGPICGKAQYFITPKIGVGLSFNYANTMVDGTVKIETEHPSTGEPISEMFDYAASIPRYRIMPMISFHPWENNTKWDPYFAFGFGYQSWKIKETKYNLGSIDLPMSWYAFRGEVGVRYYVCDNFFLNANAGMGGGPLIAGGVGYKLRIKN